MNKSEEEKKDKSSEIIINGRPQTVTEKRLSFEAIVGLAYDGNPPTGPNWVFTVTYRRGHQDKPAGTLSDGETVKIKDGMIFNVTATDKS